MKSEKNKNKRIISAVLSMSLVLTIIGITYAAFQYSEEGTKTNTVETGQVNFIYTEESNGIEITNALPMSDDQGKLIQQSDTNISNGYFDFNVESSLGNSMVIPYSVYAVDINEEQNKLDPQYVKIYLTNKENEPYEQYRETVPTYAELDNVKGPDDVQGKLLYQDEFHDSGKKEFRLRMWVNDQYEVTDEVKTFKIRVDVSTDVEVIPRDKNKPTCEVLDTTPNIASRDEDISMTIKCTDDNGAVTSTMTKDNIHVLVNNEEVEPSKKELGEGIALTEVTGENGIQHNLTLNGLNKDGPLSIKIDSGVVKDQFNNKNDEITLSTGVNISKRVTVTLLNGGGVTSFGEQDKLTCDLKEGETCNVTLPEITIKDGYTGSFWSEQETDKEGKQPGQIEVSSDTTYYAIGYKDVEVTYTVGNGVTEVGKETDTCRKTGKEETCEVTLPSITTKKGYDDEIYWEHEQENKKPDEKANVSEDTTFTAIGKDKTPPVCTLVSTSAGDTKIVKTGGVTISIKCVDNTDPEKVTLANYQGINVMLGDQDDSSSFFNAQSIDGITYNISLRNFSLTGLLSITLNEGVFTDSSKNKNIKTTITTGVTVIEPYVYVKGLKANVKEAYYIKQTTGLDMFEYSHEDGTTDYKFVGDEANNYINLLGTEAGKSEDNLWRIIGITEEENASGVKAQRLKLIRNKPLSDEYNEFSWDSSGNNNWGRPASLNTIYNGLFWNSQSGQCATYSSGQIQCDFTSTGLKSVQSKIENMKWHFGSLESYEGLTTEKIYQKERGSGSIPPGGGNSTTSNGYVGLMNISDYGYTYWKYADGYFYKPFDTTPLYSGLLFGYRTWIGDIEAYYERVLNATSENSTDGYLINSNSIFAYDVNSNLSCTTRPVVYLKSNVDVTGGQGTKTDPYTIS